MSRQVVSSVVGPAEVQDNRSATFRTSRAAESGLIIVQIRLAGTLDVTANHMEILLEQIPNPNDTTSMIHAPVTDPEEFPPVKVNQYEAQAGFLKTFPATLLGGSYNFRVIRSGDGDNSFQVQLWVDP